MTRTAADFRQHIYNLANSCHIPVCETADLPFLFSRLEVYADSSGRDRANPKLFIRSVTDEATYAIALHELGHYFAPDGIPGIFSSPIIAETAAWRWARENALDWTPTMDHIAMIALGSYCGVYTRAS